MIWEVFAAQERPRKQPDAHEAAQEDDETNYFNLQENGGYWNVTYLKQILTVSSESWWAATTARAHRIVSRMTFLIDRI